MKNNNVYNERERNEMFICECNVVKWSHSVAPHTRHAFRGDSNDCVLRTQQLTGEQRYVPYSSVSTTTKSTCGVIIYCVLLSTLHFYYTQTNWLRLTIAIAWQRTWWVMSSVIIHHPPYYLYTLRLTNVYYYQKPFGDIDTRFNKTISVKEY